jgi:hypothetical protein
MVKQCTICSEIFPRTPEFWHKKKSSKDGLSSSYCKICNVKQHNQYSKDNRKMVYERARQYRKNTRIKCLDYYSNHTMKCACCQESIFEFLTLDHIQNDGAEQRRKFGERGNFKIMLWAIKNNFPPMFQVLCWNCNCAKHLFGECPHKHKLTLKELEIS